MPVSNFSPCANFAALRAATSRHELASLLGYTPSGLSAILYRIPDAAKYIAFDIKKKSGGTRTISAPVPPLKLLQKRLSDLLYECINDLSASKPHLFQSHYGFRKGVTIFDNAAIHRGRKFVVNVDIEDFFGSINFGRVRGFFISNSGFSLHPDVATAIAQIACWKNSLPQGSPCSPIISNLIGGILDGRLARFAKFCQCTYTRYVDDITLSTNKAELSKLVARFEVSEGVWSIADELLDVINRSGFSINHSKSRVQVRGSRQVVTGLVVNRIVNTRREYALRARAMVDRLARTGSYSVWPAREKRLAGIPAELESDTLRLEGIMEYIYSIKERADLRDEKAKKHLPSSFRKTYHDFLFLKNFVLGESPLIICEGKTDNVYISSAIKALHTKYPELGQWLPTGKFKTSVRFFRYSTKTLKIMSLGGGSGDLSRLVREYRRAYSRLRKRPHQHPVIMLVDNDEGGKAVFKAVKDVSGVNIIIADPTISFHPFENFFLIKTPHVGQVNSSCIEHLFDKATLDTKIDGKSFDYEKDNDTSTTYGKHIFAEKVIRPNWQTVDFSNFEPILDEIKNILTNFP